MIIVPIILFIILFYCWFNKRYEWTLIILTTFFTEGYGFIPSSVFAIKSYDYVNVFLIIASIIGYMKDKSFFNIKKMNFVYIIYLLIAYQSFEILRTLYIGAESLGFIIKVARINIIYLSFFVLRTIPLQAFRRYIKLNLYFCIIQGIFFYLQLLGINLLQGRVDEATSTGQITRYANCPAFTLFYIFYCFFCKKNIYSKVFYLCFWGGMLILGQSRGAITVVSLAFVLYYIIKNKLKYYTILVPTAILTIYLVMPMFQYRDEGSRSNFIEDITNIVTAENFTEIENNGGTFTFRIAMLAERFNYLMENPQYMLTGVGCIHEDSPNCYERFDFIVGTENEERINGYCLIESGDITWVPILLRYGLLGAFIYLLFLVYWIISGITYLKYSKNPIYIAASLIGITSTLLTVNTVLFDSYMNTYFLLFYITYIIKYEKRILELTLVRKLFHEHSTNNPQLQ